MKFSEILKQASDLLQQRGRLSYRALRMEFDLEEEQLDVLKEQLIDVEALAVDQDGKMLVWVGATPVSSPESRDPSVPQAPLPKPQAPISYTPAHLADRIRAEQAAMESRGAADGERKTITALFADLKGSTALIEGLDPEDARAIIDPALQLMMDAVHRYDGYVAQALGDGIFALFGAPIAHEDHPQRALYAALRMQEEMRGYSDQVCLKHGVPLQMRVGINTGEVVVRSIRKDDLHTDYVPIGHSTNIAARLESLAMPGTVVVSEYTHKLVEGYFAFKSLGAAQVKGVSQPLTIYAVTGLGPLRTKIDVAVRRGLARFVGRQRELEQLTNALDQTKAGRGQIAGVMGEPGVGKSRLFYEFKLLSQAAYLILETFSVSHGKAYPYLPLIDLLKNYFQLIPQDDERQRQEKITGKVLTLDRELEEILPYLFFLLGSAEPSSALPQIDPHTRQRRTLEAIKRLFIRESLNQPLILIFEDLHWLDNETQAFLSLLGESLASAKILLLVNYRPEYRHDWGNNTYYTQLRLDPLSRADAQEMLTTLLEEKLSVLPGRERERGAHNTLQSLTQFILDKTEGNPFFMEEIMQALLEQGAFARGPRGPAGLSPVLAPKPITALHLPPTVQAVLASRIDRLPPEEKELLQTLAVIGKVFSLSLLKQVVDQSEDMLLRLLTRLRDAEFIYEQPAFPEPDYTFKHALSQEVAYHSLLIERRKVLHEQIARAIEALYSANLEDHYSQLAHHYSRGGNVQKAVDYLQLAGQQAVQRSANAEAISHLTTALELLRTLTDTPELVQQELTLQITLGVSLVMTKGYAAPEVEKAYTRALELCQQVGETPQLFSVLWGLWNFSATRAELQTARKLGEQILTLAQSVRDPALLLEAHRVLGDTLYHLGELAPTRAHLEQSIALYDPQQHRSLAFLYGGEDPGVVSLSFAAWALWHLGYPDQALHRIYEALTLAQELSYPFSLAFVLYFTASLHQFRREGQAAQERAEALIALSREQGFLLWMAAGTLLRGWALAEQGQGKEGITQIRQGEAAYQITGAQVWRPSFLALLAEVYGNVGQMEKGLTVLAEALEMAQRTGGRYYEAELYRLKGELMLQQFKVQSSEHPAPNTQAEAEAEACFHKAIEIARYQEAKSWELRATMSVARLWQQQGKKAEAQQLLAEIYGWFTEGFDTKDLHEAKILLEELAANRR